MPSPRTKAQKLTEMAQLEDYAKNWKTSLGESPTVVVVPVDVFLLMTMRVKFWEALQADLDAFG